MSQRLVGAEQHAWLYVTGGGTDQLFCRQWEDTEAFSVAKWQGHFYVLSHLESCIDQVFLKKQKCISFLVFSLFLLKLIPENNKQTKNPMRSYNKKMVGKMKG